MDSGDLKEKKPIPKFTSFKPKPTEALPTRESRHGSEQAEESSKRRERRHTSRHHRHEDQSHTRRRSRERDGHRVLSRPKGKEYSDVTSAAERHDRPLNQDGSELFTVDRKGDDYNLIYGTLHRYSIPIYYRVGRGSVLGLPPGNKIDRNYTDGTKLDIRTGFGGDDSSKQKNQAVLAKQARKRLKVYRVRQDPHANPDTDLEKDFLPFQAGESKKRRRTAEGVPYKSDSSDEGESAIDYRSIEGKAKAETIHDEELYSDESSDNDGESARQRNMELTRRTAAHPEDIENWLQLIDHQDALVGTLDGEGERRLTAAEKRSVADIRISLCEKALSKMPRNAPRDRLLIRMMEEGSNIWDTGTLAQQWRNVIQSNPTYVSLWFKYLDFQQTRFVNFTYERCRAVFLDCLKINSAHTKGPEQNTINLYLLLRLSLFVREAGFSEHATAIWQAILEFNFFRPKHLDTLDAAMSSFDEFWDSEVARIGEPGAKGWDNPDGASVDARTAANCIPIDETALFQTWERAESYQSCNSLLPARTLDDVREDDPYRVVLSSDIKDFLVPFTESDILVDAFLLFCRLPPLASYQQSAMPAQWRGDPFLSNTVLDHPNGRRHQWFSDLVPGPDNTSQTSPTAFPHHDFANNTDTLFGSQASWFSELLGWRDTYSANDSAIKVDFVRQTLKQLVERLPSNDDLAEYAVALESAVDLKEAKKYSKSLLKKRPSNLRLYNAYALVECRIGGITAAERVWATTLSMSQSFSHEDRAETILLWRTWLWELLNSHDTNKVIRLLLRIPDKTVAQDMLAESDTTMPSSTEILKSQMHLTESLESGLSTCKPNIFVSSTECLALLSYLTQGTDIESALEIYRTAESRLSNHNLSESIFSELLHQAKAKLLYFHATSTQKYKPSLLRKEFSASISKFPHNTIFLSLFAWNERRFRIDDRVRAVAREQTSSSTRSEQEPGTTAAQLHTRSTLIPHFFSIYTELHRGVSAGSTAHSARSAFEGAVRSSSGQCSAALWKLYVLFELELKQHRKAQDVFYRAIRACPWAKELVMLAFREPGLRSFMNADELRKVWNVFVEKELRIHVDLEEWFEKREGGPRQDERGETKLPFQMPDDRSSDEEI